VAVPRWKLKCNRVASRFRAVGGTLQVEGDTLWFRPSDLERRLDADDWSIPLADVTGFRVAPVSVLDLFSGGLRPRLALDEGRKATHLFVVRDPKKIAAELLAVAVEPVDGPFPGEGPPR
jgi:hypothetical protein